MQKRKQKKTIRNRYTAVFNDGMYLISIAGALFTLPQFIQIWTQKQAQGVSLITWLAYASISALWLVYGFVHKEKQIILAQTLLVVLDFGVVAGVLAYR